MATQAPAAAQPSTLMPVNNRWNDFISNRQDANIFHHPRWMAVLQGCYHFPAYVVTYPESGQIRAGLPVMAGGNVLRGKRLISLPFSDQCQPLACDEQALRGLVERLARMEKMKEYRCAEFRCELPSHPALFATQPYVLHTLPLAGNPERTAAGFHPTHQRNIRTAQKNRIEIVWGTELAHIKEYYTLHLETRRRQGVPVQPWKFFELIASELLEHGFGFVLLAYQGKQCIAGAVFLHYQRTLTYKFGASTLAGLEYRPNNLIFWEAIRWGCNNGYAKLDMGRTDLENVGLRRFKKGWGATETALTYTSTKPVHLDTGRNRLAAIAASVIRHTPALVCRLSGEFLYRLIGS